MDGVCVRRCPVQSDRTKTASAEKLPSRADRSFPRALLSQKMFLCSSSVLPSSVFSVQRLLPFEQH